MNVFSLQPVCFIFICIFILTHVVTHCVSMPPQICLRHIFLRCFSSRCVQMFMRRTHNNKPPSSLICIATARAALLLLSPRAAPGSALAANPVGRSA